MKRLLLAAGLVGLLVNGAEFVLNGVLLRGDWDQAMRSLARPPVGPAAIGMLAVLVFVLAALAVALFAALRPHFTRAAAAALAASAAWLAAYPIGLGWTFAMGLYPAKIYFATVIWSFCEWTLAMALATRWCAPGALRT